MWSTRAKKMVTQNCSPTNVALALCIPGTRTELASLLEHAAFWNAPSALVTAAGIVNGAPPMEKNWFKKNTEGPDYQIIRLFFETIFW